MYPEFFCLHCSPTARIISLLVFCQHVNPAWELPLPLNELVNNYNLSLPRVSSSFRYIFSVTHLYSWVERSTVVEIYTVWCLRLLLHGPNSDQIWLSWNGAQSTQTIRLPIDFKLWKEVLNKEINVIPSECLNPMEGNICPMSSLCLLRPWIWRKKWSNVQISMADSIIARATSHDYADLSYFV